MKIISFSCVEKLPALLRWRDEKLEWQTIRPAWKECRCKGEGYSLVLDQGTVPATCNCHNGFLEKPPRFKVCENVQLMWKQRSGYLQFCSICGCGGSARDEIPYLPDIPCQDDGNMNWFPKLLGTGPVTEIFKIEMDFDNHGRHGISFPKGHKTDGVMDLAMRDGFDPAKEFSEYFNKNYDLSTPKPFYCYRGGWD